MILSGEFHGILAGDEQQHNSARADPTTAANDDNRTRWNHRHRRGEDAELMINIEYSRKQKQLKLMTKTTPDAGGDRRQYLLVVTHAITITTNIPLTNPESGRTGSLEGRQPPSRIVDV
jgi:hypothetical protein